MSETTPTPDGNQADAQGNSPSFRVVSQYVKDLSFENPNSPQIFQQNLSKPGVDMEVNMNARPLGNDMFEVEMSINCTAKEKEGDMVHYVVETNYAGLFEIKGIPEQNLGGVLLVECPTLLFPFARQIVAEAVQNGGFMPLMLEPMNFAAMYQHQQEQMRQQAAAQPTTNETGNA